jgi:hypothetical protein
MGELISILDGSQLDTSTRVELDTSKLDQPDHPVYKDIEDTQEVFGASAAQADLDTAQMLMRVGQHLRKS